MSTTRRLWLPISLLFAAVVTGTAWYALVEAFPPLDALFMAVTTITTVGYREVQPLDTSGRLFTIVYILTGVGLVFYTVVAVAQALLVGEVAEMMGLRRENRRVRKMQDHFVLCGFGRVGEEIARELHERGSSFVVVDRDPERAAVARQRGYLTVVGDATEEPVLREAGVERSRVLIAAADSDAGNTFVTLAARAMNTRLFIIARAGTGSAEQRMRTAGANRVISPYLIAGRRMALAAVQPLLLGVVEVPGETRAEGVNLLAEFVVGPDAPGFAGKTIAEAFAGLRMTRVLAVETPGGEVIVGPPGARVLQVGDRLVLHGDHEEIEELSPARGGAPAAGTVANGSSA
jgi:voltage-gated potassium channel